MLGSTTQPPPPPPPLAMTGPPHFVDLHVNPGESVSIQMLDGNETILRGPATITMVSQHTFPPVPMPVQVPPGHMVQQIVDENGTLRHIILSALNNNGGGSGGPPTSSSSSSPPNSSSSGGGGGGSITTNCSGPTVTSSTSSSTASSGPSAIIQSPSGGGVITSSSGANSNSQSSQQSPSQQVISTTTGASQLSSHIQPQQPSVNGQPPSTVTVPSAATSPFSAAYPCCCSCCYCPTPATGPTGHLPPPPPPNITGHPLLGCFPPPLALPNGTPLCSTPVIGSSGPTGGTNGTHHGGGQSSGRRRTPSRGSYAYSKRQQQQNCNSTQSHSPSPHILGSGGGSIHLNPLHVSSNAPQLLTPCPPPVSIVNGGGLMPPNSFVMPPPPNMTNHNTSSNKSSNSMPSPSSKVKSHHHHSQQHTQQQNQQSLMVQSSNLSVDGSKLFIPQSLSVSGVNGRHSSSYASSNSMSQQQQSQSSSQIRQTSSNASSTTTTITDLHHHQQHSFHHLQGHKSYQQFQQTSTQQQSNSNTQQQQTANTNNPYSSGGSISSNLSTSSSPFIPSSQLQQLTSSELIPQSSSSTTSSTSYPVAFANSTGGKSVTTQPSSTPTSISSLIASSTLQVNCKAFKPKGVILTPSSKAFVPSSQVTAATTSTTSSTTISTPTTTVASTVSSTSVSPNSVDSSSYSEVSSLDSNYSRSSSSSVTNVPRTLLTSRLTTTSVDSRKGGGNQHNQRKSTSSSPQHNTHHYHNNTLNVQPFSTSEHVVVSSGLPIVSSSSANTSPSHHYQYNHPSNRLQTPSIGGVQISGGVKTTNVKSSREGLNDEESLGLKRNQTQPRVNSMTITNKSLQQQQKQITPTTPVTFGQVKSKSSPSSPAHRSSVVSNTTPTRVINASPPAAKVPIERRNDHITATTTTAVASISNSSSMSSVSMEGESRNNSNTREQSKQLAQSLAEKLTVAATANTSSAIVDSESSVRTSQQTEQQINSNQVAKVEKNSSSPDRTSALKNERIRHTSVPTTKSDRISDETGASTEKGSEKAISLDDNSKVPRRGGHASPASSSVKSDSPSIQRVGSKASLTGGNREKRLSKDSLLFLEDDGTSSSNDGSLRSRGRRRKGKQETSSKGSKTGRQRPSSESEEDEDEPDYVPPPSPPLETGDNKANYSKPTIPSPKHLGGLLSIPSVQLLNLTYTALTASSVKLKWNLVSSSDPHPPDQHQILVLLQQKTSSSGGLFTQHFTVEMILSRPVSVAGEQQEDSQKTAGEGEEGKVSQNEQSPSSPTSSSSSSSLLSIRNVWAGNANNCRVSHLCCGQQYSFRVRTFVDSSYSVVSNVLTITTPEQALSNRQGGSGAGGKSRGATPLKTSESSTQNGHNQTDLSRLHDSSSRKGTIRDTHPAAESNDTVDDPFLVEKSDQRRAVLILLLFTGFALIIAVIIQHLLAPGVDESLQSLSSVNDVNPPPATSSFSSSQGHYQSHHHHNPQPPPQSPPLTPPAYLPTN